MQLPYNSRGSYLVDVLFSQCVYFPINDPGRLSGKPGTWLVGTGLLTATGKPIGITTITIYGKTLGLRFL